ncbi:MAG: amidohydrolase family protein, partial [Acidobacteria bacterium]|nr:amidohydrolase family protein [Acidobacteriota bacterium]
MNTRRLALLCGLLAGVLAATSWAAEQPVSGRRSARLAIRGALIVDGAGTPASGPRDILIEGNRISAIVSPEAGKRFAADAEIDARGKYVLPGFINLHGHIQDERAGRPMPVDYCLKLWLASGITSVRDVGSNWEKARQWRAASQAGTLAAPRLFLYPMLAARNPEQARAEVRRLKEEGADGLKSLGVFRDVMDTVADEAARLGLRRAHHAGVEETNAWDDIRTSTTSIEHWYGIPDAALGGGVQAFPPGYNYSNELDRFRYAGRLWREAEPARLSAVLDAMVKAKVAWDPTLSIYEAARDLDKAANQPYFRDYLHPALEAFFRPNLDNHGSFYTDWTTEDEIYWKENYRIWMKALKDFAGKGGLVGTGEDAGFIYRIYGFGYLRELELQQEAGFHPLQVIKHATLNGAAILGRESELGRVRAGWLADLVVVNSNPLQNFKALYPHNGGIEWTI